MSTTMRDLRDEEEEEEAKPDGDEEDGEESEEDEDYVPNPESDEESDGDEGAYDEDVPEVGGAAVATKSGAKKGAGTKRKASTAKVRGRGVSGGKRARGAGIMLEEEEVEPSFEHADAPEVAPEAHAASDETRSVELSGKATDSASAGEGVSDATASAPEAAERSRADDLWAELQGTASSSNGGGSSCSKKASGSSGLDIKALLAKTSGASSSAVKSGGMVEIKQTVDFCGEDVVITKQVKAGSKEELAARQTTTQTAAPAPKSKTDVVANALAASAELRRQMSQSQVGRPGQPAPSSTLSSAVKFDASLEFKAALPAPKLPGVQAAKPTGLQGLLATIDGKKKLSTMEKSRHDWGQYKDQQDEKTRDDMERFAKDGYLAKVAFLQRTDARQAEVARTNRRRGMGLKD